MESLVYKLDDPCKYDEVQITDSVLEVMGLVQQEVNLGIDRMPI